MARVYKTRKHAIKHPKTYNHRQSHVSVRNGESRKLRFHNRFPWPYARIWFKSAIPHPSPLQSPDYYQTPRPTDHRVRPPLFSASQPRSRVHNKSVFSASQTHSPVVLSIHLFTESMSPSQF
ncbi:hypothetical protein PIB30_030346 [Stylosanthes scabra]|uniref:Uncharacterized protein n=1 Tax=Stylosanthes scabra TaxID=79078 RepID=A0ABU6UAB0_9FABA|nr:hypothetical protein [Stylosanthes scabra]